MPAAKVRLSAGRTRLSDEIQALCFYAGANSIFYGEKLLTAENPAAEADRALLAKLGLKVLEPDVSIAAPEMDPSLPASPCAPQKEPHACGKSSCASKVAESDEVLAASGQV